MENVIVKYSDFFEDDGGFDQIRKDFDALGDDLIAKAKKIKSEVKLFDLDEAEGIKEFEDQTEDLTKAFKKYGEAKEKIVEIENEYLKQINKTVDSNEDQIKKLVQLDKQLQEYRGQLKEINTFAKLGLKTDRDLNKERVEAQLNIKKVNKEINKQQKEILESNKLTTKQNKLLKAKITLEKTEIKTLEDVRERMAALRLVVQTLDLETQTEQIAEFNEEINELTQVLSDNSDKFIQNKINIGNYEESIVNALKNTNAFATGIGALDSALDSIVGLLLLTQKELEAMEKSMDGNTTAVKRFAIAFGKLNKVLKASIIGVVLLAVAALGSAFGNTRAGAVRLEKVMKTVSSAFATFGKVATAVFSGIGEGFVILFDTVSGFIAQNKGKSFGQLLKDFFTGDVGVIDALGENFVKQIDNVKKTFNEVVDLVKNGADAVVLGLENIDNAFKIEDKIRRLNVELARLQGRLSLLQSQSDDSTISLERQLEATQKALELTDEIGAKRVEIARAQLELANENVKQSILANGVEAKNINLGLQGVAFAEAVARLAEERGVSLEIANDLIVEQNSAVLDLIDAESELALSREENAKKQREINRDIFEQNLDLLIDLIDTEKNISEQFVNDITKNFQSRVNEFNRFLVAFRRNAQRELDEFSKEASNLGLDLDFSIQYDENGDFKVFVGDTELAVDNIVALNKQLQSLGLNEIDINRFREFIVEARNGVRDFRELSKSLVQVGIDIKELRRNISISRDELNSINQLQLKIDKLSSTIREGVSAGDQKKILKQIEELERQKQAITDNADDKRLRSRIKAIDDELATVEVGSQRYYELLQERSDIEIDLATRGSDKALDRLKQTNKRLVAEQKKYADEVRQILDAVLDKVLEVNQKRVDAAEDQRDKQNDIIEEQRRRAEEGLTNTLAFEQRELGKREAELIKRQKKQERLEKIRALYSSYQNYASKGDENPILKALRDFAILEAISASFKHGGLTGIDGVKTNAKGITTGKRHNADGTGGNLAWHEVGEGFFSRKEVDAMGHDNFYKLKHMAGNGQIDSNFFSRQRNEFVKAVRVPSKQPTDPRLLKSMKEVKQSIDNKPVQQVDVIGITDGVIKVVETILTKNKVKRNHFQTKKPRL